MWCGTGALRRGVAETERSNTLREQANLHHAAPNSSHLPRAGHAVGTCVFTPRPLAQRQIDKISNLDPAAGRAHTDIPEGAQMWAGAEEPEHRDAAGPKLSSSKVERPPEEEEEEFSRIHRIL